MWYKMILESFKNQTSKDDCLGYFVHQFKIRKDSFLDTYFYKQCQEHTISLKEAFEAILANNSKLPDFPTPIIEQVYECEFVFGYDKKNEFAFFNDDKSPFIKVKDFDNIFNSLEGLIIDCNYEVSDVESVNTKKIEYNSFKLRKLNEKFIYLTDFKNRLVENRLIHKNTKLGAFRKIFSGEVIEKRVIWTGNRSELYYMVKRLYVDLKLVEDLKQQQWAVTVKCFVDADGNPYNRTSFKSLHPPATSNKIDSALKILL